MIDSLLHRIVKLRGYKIVKNDEGLIKNYFNTSFDKNVLISYLEEPFLQEKTSTKHTNYKVSKILAKIFKTLNYNVDIVDFHKNDKLIDNNYDVVWGFGIPFFNCIANSENENLYSIFHSTGCSLHHRNSSSIKRLLDFKFKKGKILFEGSRIETHNWEIGAHFANAIVVNGNEFGPNTFPKDLYPCIKKPLKLGFHKTVEIDLSKKNYDSNKKNFLWFGGFGAIHKGLDLLLNVFSKRKDINLHICGITKNSSPEFLKIYHEELFNSDNIYFHDIVDLQSDLFKQIMETCCFAIFPSASEGGNPSTLTAMGNGGLLPIVPETCSIDSYGYGLNINSLTETDIENSIDAALKIVAKNLQKKSIELQKKIEEQHSFKLFETNTLKLIKQLLDIK